MQVSCMFAQKKQENPPLVEKIPVKVEIRRSKKYSESILDEVQACVSGIYGIYVSWLSRAYCP